MRLLGESFCITSATRLGPQFVLHALFVTWFYYIFSFSGGRRTNEQKSDTTK